MDNNENHHWNGSERRSDGSLFLQEILKQITNKLEKLEVDISSLHASVTALHMWKADVNSAFPNENFEVHKIDHIEIQDSKKDRKAILLEVKKKVVSGVLWAALVFGAYSVYDRFLATVTTAAGANMVSISDGQMARSTSALKYKQNIRDLESIDINKFRPVRYKSKCANDDQTKDHFGVIADEVDATPAQVALAWCLHRPWDVLPIPGSSKPKHLRENARAANIKLTPAQVKLLDTTFAPNKVKGAGAQMAPMRSGA